LIKLLSLFGGLEPQLPESPALKQFFEAAKSGNSQEIKNFIDNSHIHPNFSNSKGMTAIAYAAHYGRTEVVDLLLDQYQADPSIPDTVWQQTPLFRAAKGGYVAIVKRLLTCDVVGVNTPDKDGQTALAVAAAHGWIDVVKVLLAYKSVDITYVDCDGRSALSRAKSEQIKGLLKAALEGDEYIFV
jgi:ankyrin repeat protein